jgi:hypothetical protein
MSTQAKLGILRTELCTSSLLCPLNQGNDFSEL